MSSKAFIFLAAENWHWKELIVPSHVNTYLLKCGYFVVALAFSPVPVVITTLLRCVGANSWYCSVSHGQLCVQPFHVPMFYTHFRLLGAQK